MHKPRFLYGEVNLYQSSVGEILMPLHLSAKFNGMQFRLILLRRIISSISDDGAFLRADILYHDEQAKNAGISIWLYR